MILRQQRPGMLSSSLLCLIVVLGCLVAYQEAKKSDPESKPAWAKKDIRDMDDADMERLFDQWEEDDEPLEEDELPEYKRPPKPNPTIDFEKIRQGKMSADQIMKATKKGKTVMMFLSVSGDPSKQETEEITSLWQGALRNSHIQAERYVIEDHRAIFMFADGEQAWEAKDFLVGQDRLKELTLEGQVIPGKGASKSEL